MGDGFYRPKDPTNSIEVLKERSGTKHEIREYRKLVAADLSVVTVYRVHALLTIAEDQILRWTHNVFFLHLVFSTSEKC